MDALTGRDGKFSFTIGSKQLVRGLRPVKQNPRNNDFLVTCTGAVGINGALQVIDTITRIATAAITDAFPYPQIFVFTNVIIVCGAQTIYEWTGSALSLKYTAAAASGTWSAVDFYNYIYMSNGAIAVIRDGASLAWALTSALPAAQAICNYNGQILIGAPV